MQVLATYLCSILLLFLVIFSFSRVVFKMNLSQFKLRQKTYNNIPSMELRVRVYGWIS